MLTCVVVAWAPAALSLMLVACGSKGDLVLPKAEAPQPAPSAASPARAVPSTPPATPAAPAAPSPATPP